MTAAGKEEMRLQALTQLNLLDTPASESFDRITRMASKLFDLPIAAVSLTDRDRQWFKSRVGVDHWQIPRERAPCAQVSDTAGTLVIPDLLEDPCYSKSLLAQSGIRFYAGAPLVTRDGYALGAMCVLGTEPRQITEGEQSALADLAAMVIAQIELQHAFGRIEPVSGLPNRHQLLDDLQDQARDFPGSFRAAVTMEIADPSRTGEAMRVLGPGAMDDLLRASTHLLRSALGSETKLYQVGPAHFAWLIDHPEADGQSCVLPRVSEMVEAYLSANTLRALAHPAVGVAPFRFGETSGEDVLRTAYSAAQDARKGDSRISIYSAAADEAHRRRFQLLADMPDALAAPDQLSLVYQPRVSLETGACVGAEALIRWRHPTLGNVSPGEFIPVVEQTDLSRPVTEWVIAAAIAQASAWRRRGIDMPISVNVAAPNLEEADFAARLAAALSSADLPAAAIELEVTESAVIRNGHRVADQLNQVRAAGIKVAIDDFGTGYSSLSYLQQLPADVVKIDQSFVRDLGTNERARTLVRSLVGMAKNLQLEVVAEGVEDPAAYEFCGPAHATRARAT